MERVVRNAFLMQSLGHNRTTTGPVPSSGASSVERNSERQAFTYAMRFGGTDIWKFGWCFDPELRRKRLNAHIPTEVVGLEWSVEFTQAWPSATLAYAMEQAMLKRLCANRTIGERVKVAERHILPNWIEAIRDCAD